MKHSLVRAYYYSLIYEDGMPSFEQLYDDDIRLLKKSLGFIQFVIHKGIDTIKRPFAKLFSKRY